MSAFKYGDTRFSVLHCENPSLSIAKHQEGWNLEVIAPCELFEEEEKKMEYLKIHTEPQTNTNEKWYIEAEYLKMIFIDKNYK